MLPVDDLPNTTPLSHGYNVYMPGGQERSGREMDLSLSPHGQPGLVYVLSSSCVPHDLVSGFADTQTMLSDDSSPLVGASSRETASIPNTPLLLCFFIVVR